MEKYSTKLRVYVNQDKQHNAAVTSFNKRPTLLACDYKDDELIDSPHVEQTCFSTPTILIQSQFETIKLVVPDHLLFTTYSPLVLSFKMEGWA